MSDITSESSTRAEAARNTFLLGIVQVWKVALGFASTIILARLLVPTDFGLAAMIATALALIWVFQDLGLAQAVIQRQVLTREQINFSHWCCAGMSLVLAALMVGGAPFFAAFFGDGRLVDLTRAYACLIVMGGVQAIPMALLTRESRFKTIAALETIAATGGFVVGVLSAIAWQSYWALFLSALASTLLSLVGAWIATGFRPGIPKFDQGSREILHFGSSLTGFNFVNYFSRNADNVLLGRYYGSVELGLYDRAYRLLLFPITQLQGTTSRVMVPLLSRLLSDPPKYRQAYLECVTLMMIVAQPGIAFLIVYASEIFQVLLGEQWAGAVPIFQILGIVGLPQVMTTTFGWLFVSQARAGEILRIGSVSALITVLAFVIGLPWGGLGLATAYCLSHYVQLPVTWLLIGRRGPVSALDLSTTALAHVAATSGAILFLITAHVSMEGFGVFASPIILSITYAVYLCILACLPGKRTILTTILRALGNIHHWGGRSAA